MKGFFVTGTDTDVGKTVAAGIITHYFSATYWKPVQAGTEPTTDSRSIAAWLGEEVVLSEGLVLREPRSPNQAAEMEGRQIALTDFKLPEVEGPLIVEGAGGLMVPLDEKHMMVDLITHFGLPAILVARSGLGTLNHTLLSVEALKTRGITLHGIVLNGPEHQMNARDIQHFSGVPIIGRISRLERLSTETFAKVARDWQWPTFSGT